MIAESSKMLNNHPGRGVKKELKEKSSKMSSLAVETPLYFESGTHAKIPSVGFGTFQIVGGGIIKEVLNNALQTGYRSIDTAAVYRNEKDIGYALKELLPKFKLTREDIFITSKLPPNRHGELAIKALRQTLSNLRVDYLDLYLIHWPGRQGVPIDDPENASIRAKSWEMLVQAKKEKLVRNIGVSNYTVRHLCELLSNDFGVKPAVNQVECHPHFRQEVLVQFCKQEGIIVQAYSSLGGSRNTHLLLDKNVVAIAKDLEKSAAQVLLRWALQHKLAVIPKARNKRHIANNFDLNFTIPQEHMHVLDNLHQVKYAWDPENVL